MHPGSPSDPSWTAAEQSTAKLHTLDFKTTWSEFQKTCRTAAMRDKGEQHIYNL